MSLHIREFNKYPNEKRLCRASITKKKRGDKPIMSFVFAKKTTVLNNETIKVFCDTKIGLVDGAKGTFSDKQIELIKHYGIVKNTIICPEYSISFAGNNIFHASKLFRRLYEKKCFSRDEVIDLAYEIHKNAINQSDIEFIICSCENSKFYIDCIKNGEKDLDVPSAWLGSITAFNEFQEHSLSHEDRADGRSMLIDFQSVVENCSDDSVGGFPISVSYSNSLPGFCYDCTYNANSVKECTVKPGEAIPFYLSASDGGYSYIIKPYGIESLLVQVDQMFPDILYSRCHRISEQNDRNDNLFSLMLPMLVSLGNEGKYYRYDYD